MADIRIACDALSAFCVEALRKVGLPEPDARIVTEVLVSADRRGVASHGVVALPGYVHHLQGGGITPSPDIKVVSEGAAYALLDGGAGMGPVVAARATEIAIAKAQTAGIGFVTVRNSNHFGAAAWYAMKCASAGLIGEAMSNSPPMMAPTGAAARVLGNNPLSIAIPTGGAEPIVLDMAMSAVAGGRVINAATAGKSIPEGWLTGPGGAPTTDPNDWHKGGALLPFGGYKGYGLALCIEALTGGLSGAGMLDGVTSWRRQAGTPSNTAHTIRAVKIEAFMPLAEFRARIDRLVSAMKNAPRATGVAEIFMPGEIEARAEATSLVEGCRLSGEAFAALVELSAHLSIAAPRAEAAQTT